MPGSNWAGNDIMCLSKLFKGLFGVKQVKFTEYVKHSDPRVAETNGNRGLLVREEQTGPNQWTFYYESGKKTYIGTPGKPSDFNSNGITTTVLPRILWCISDVKRGRDLSMWPDNYIFDAKVYLSEIIIVDDVED